MAACIAKTSAADVFFAMKHPAVLKRVPEGWWKPSMSVRTGEPSVPDEVDIALQKQLSDALRDMQARRDKRARSSSTGSIGDVDVACVCRRACQRRSTSLTLVPLCAVLTITTMTGWSQRCDLRRRFL